MNKSLTEKQFEELSKLTPKPNEDYYHDQAMQQIANKQSIEISEWRDIDKHPLPNRGWVDIKLECGSVLVKCLRKFWNHPYPVGAVYFGDVSIEHMNKTITQWRPSK